MAGLAPARAGEYDLFKDTLEVFSIPLWRINLLTEEVGYRAVTFALQPVLW